MSTYYIFPDTTLNKVYNYIVTRIASLVFVVLVLVRGSELQGPVGMVILACVYKFTYMIQLNCTGFLMCSLKKERCDILQ